MKKTKLPASLWFWSDWDSDPSLRACGFAAQGLWMKMLCIAARHDPIGYVSVNGNGLDCDTIARMTGGVTQEVELLIGELERNGVFSRDRNGTIYCRKMRKGGVWSRGLFEARSSIPMSLRIRIYQRDNSTCQYCGAMQGPFELDHIIPWSKGGRHKMRNLKVACQPCNRSKGAKNLGDWLKNISKAKA